MAGVTNVPLYMNPTSQSQQQQALDMMRAQLLSQQFAQSGEQPADNEMAGNVVVKHSPLEYASRQISQNMGSLMQLRAAKMQMALMGQNMGGGATGGNPAMSGSGGITPQSLRTAAMYDQMYGAGSGKAYLDSLQPTPDMKNAAASNVATPLDYSNQSAQNTARANANMKPTTYTTPDGKTIQTTEAGLAGMAGGSMPSQNQSAPPLPPSSIKPVADDVPGMQGMMNTVPNGQPVPPVPAAAQGSPLPPPAGFTQINGAVTPPQATTSPATQQSFGQAVQQAQQGMQGGMQVQSPAQGKGMEQAATNGIQVQNDINKNADQALELKRNLGQMKNYFQDFTPGKAAGLRQAIAQYEVQMGSQDPDTVKLAGATEGVDKLAATQALETMKAMNAIGGGNGNGGNRVEFQALLANTPNKSMTPAGAQSVMDFMSKGADMALNKQKEFSTWKQGKQYSDYQDFPTYWNQKRADALPSTLSNIQTAQPSRVITYDATGKRVSQ